ncbi:unnamed protein product [Lymnaea stagnalis]|uniref:C-type lectin domain-containing protein n=1 Tax=Lymnaea stagnalis TaxID=6523 RepID=A0AAV2H6P5_LYMST
MPKTCLCALLYLSLINDTVLQYSFINEKCSFLKSKQSFRTTIIGAQWTVASKIKCLAKCLEIYSDSCQSFMYNTATLKCTPGANVQDGLFSATSADEELYVKYPNFRVQSYLSTSICAIFFNGHKTYSDARDICRVYNAHLFVPRSAESYALFKSMIDLSQNAWVGLNDVDVTWKYMAEDDGQEMDISSILSLFAHGGPDHYQQQHCITTFIESEGQLEDEECDSKNTFVCQTEFSNC